MPLGRQGVFALYQLLLLCCAPRAIAQLNNIAFTYPPPLDGANSVLSHFFPNQLVTFTWTSTWPSNTLELWQGHGDENSSAMVELLTNVTNTTTSYQWSAHVLAGMTQEDYLHLRIYNAKNPDCARCHANSTRFNIVSRAGGGDNQQHLKLGLGLGLGLGIPLLLALVGILAWICVRRKKGSKRDGTGSSTGTGEELMGYRQEQQGGVPHIAGEDMRKSYEPPAEDGMKDRAEVEGNGVVEMAHERDVVEMPASGMEQRETVELEGDMEHRGGNGR